MSSSANTGFFIGAEISLVFWLPGPQLASNTANAIGAKTREMFLRVEWNKFLYIIKTVIVLVYQRKVEKLYQMASNCALYIVATPIGNLDDLSIRAKKILQSVDLIAAEDTRYTRRLLEHYAIDTRTIAYHEHSSDAQTNALLSEIEGGKSIALVSDAGTPLISDPGYPLVSEARNRGVRVVPVVGACALIAALSASGLPSDHFCFEGFLPSKKGARRSALSALKNESRTLVFYEAPHRIQACLADAAEIFGEGREAVLARELTKTFETFIPGTIATIQAVIANDPMQLKGEMVMMFRGKKIDAKTAILDAEAERVLKLLMVELPTNKAAALAAKITGIEKRQLYDHAVSLKNEV
jgi:16S rRNA (cytidine1402-2'-O)-methyltransferase